MIEIEKLKEPLTLEKQNELIKRLAFYEILIMLQHRFLKEKGLFEESIAYVNKNAENVTTDDFDEEINEWRNEA